MCIRDRYTDYLHQVIDEQLAAHRQTEENTIHYHYVSFSGIMEDNTIIFDESKLGPSVDFSKVWQVFIIPLDDYNQIMGTEETVAEGEALLYATKTNFKYDEITLDGIGTFRVKNAQKGFVANETDTMQIMPSLFMFVPDVTNALNSVNEMLAQMGEEERAYVHDYYGFDLACSEEEQTEIYNGIMEMCIRDRNDCLETATDARAKGTHAQGGQTDGDTSLRNQCKAKVIPDFGGLFSDKAA